MAVLIGIVAISLMVLVLVIAAASLVIVGTLPMAKALESWRGRRSRADLAE